jgi:hypothetical protein
MDNDMKTFRFIVGVAPLWSVVLAWREGAALGSSFCTLVGARVMGAGGTQGSASARFMYC